MSTWLFNRNLVGSRKELVVALNGHRLLWMHRVTFLLLQQSHVHTYFLRDIIEGMISLGHAAGELAGRFVRPLDDSELVSALGSSRKLRRPISQNNLVIILVDTVDMVQAASALSRLKSRIEVIHRPVGLDRVNQVIARAAQLDVVVSELLVRYAVIQDQSSVVATRLLSDTLRFVGTVAPRATLPVRSRLDAGGSLLHGCLTLHVTILEPVFVASL